MELEAHANQSSAREQPDQADAFVRVGPLMSVPALLREFDCSPEQILSKSGLSLAQFEEPDTEISFLTGSRMLANCVSATGCQLQGLQQPHQVI